MLNEQIRTMAERAHREPLDAARYRKLTALLRHIFRLDKHVEDGLSTDPAVKQAETLFEAFGEKHQASGELLQADIDELIDSLPEIPV